ncbi:MAG: molybdopterin-binding protein [Sphingomonadaceae bacterium]|uniref:competence/damage-inducible protein A n=1 Tax=Thermaurantiacus sp. TaxID=2820283 RepID=UPI00298EE960|nr:molybdopterin-binding protein [Thermaurantiacus sp.]MCS6987170.1 molybdopterin-binding protein [Sphingomonadaceae bacterium]MDW8415796.1 molybdopterin-binding protein [Thermaurantiacus sp.]
MADEPSASERVWTAAVVVIGDEILSGRTQDQNLAFIARWLNLQGIRLREARVVPDDVAAIGGAVTECLAAYDYVFTTGGIGPTHDDVTVEAIAAALKLPVVRHPEAEAMLRRHYGERITEARLRMARVPEGAQLIPNPETGAPGIRLGRLFILAGVPKITQGMLRGLEGQLEGGRPLLSAAVGAWTAESRVADLLARTQADHPEVQIGSYPFWRDGRTGANFVIRAVEPARLRAAVDALKHALAADGIEAVEGEL